METPKKKEKLLVMDTLLEARTFNLDVNITKSIYFWKTIQRKILFPKVSLTCLTWRLACLGRVKPLRLLP